MIVEPTPARSPGRRPPTAVAAAGLAVTLAAVIGAGLLGADGSGDPAASTEAIRGSDAAPGLDGPVIAAPAPPAAAEAIAFPAEALGLPVRPVAGVVTDRRAARVRGLVAIAGFLTIAGRPIACPERAPGIRAVAAGRTRPFCRREAILAARPVPSLDGPEGIPSADRLGPHLHLQVAPGTALPFSVEPPFGNDVRAGVAVVVLASFDDPRGEPGRCGSSGFRCGGDLVIERVVWADGRWREARWAADPDVTPAAELSRTERRVLVGTALPGSGPLLAEALVAPRTLELVDAAAAAAVGPVERPVWYLRLLADRSPEDAGAWIAWLVVEDATGRVLASSG